MEFGNGAERHGTIILIFCILAISTIIIIELIKSHRLRKIFNFTKELRKLRVRKLKKNPNLNPVTDCTKSTLIGHIRKKPVYIPDEAKHIFICGTTGSGKTVAISNFIKHTVENDYPALIVDGKGDIGEGSILSLVTQMTKDTGKKVYVINLSDIKN